MSVCLLQCYCNAEDYEYDVENKTHIKQYCVHERPEDDVSVNFNSITSICNLGQRVLHMRNGLAKNLLLSLCVKKAFVELSISCE